MIKVLFLDIDGVVLSGEALQRTGNHRHLPPEKVALVNDVCERTGAMIVVSSTWRQIEGCLPILQAGGLRPFHTDWRTGKNTKVGSIWIGCPRGQEIQDWLDAHPEVSAYAIVDDDSDMLPEQMSRFVKTGFPIGIEQRHVDALVDCLAIPVGAK